MTTVDPDDPLLRNLRRVPMLSPDEARVERIRARCHAAIARQRVQLDRSARRAKFIARVLEPALVGGLGLIYLSAVIRDVLRLHGML
jgi:hypothetical protein